MISRTIYIVVNLNARPFADLHAATVQLILRIAMMRSSCRIPEAFVEPEKPSV